MKKKITGIVILLIIVATGIWYFTRSEKENAVSFVTVQPKNGTIAISVTATGTIQPVDTVAVGTQVSGTISKVFVDFNSVVKKGQLLAQLDQTLLESQTQLIAANLQQARANANYQQQNYNRQSQLYNVGAIAKADFETAANAYNIANENIKSVTAQLRAAQKNLSFTNIYSPIDGTVLSRNISEGQTVAASLSTPTLFSIAKDLTKMQVRASVDEADIGNVQQGEAVTFTVDAFPNDIFKGSVQQIRLQPSVASNVVTYTTIINTANDDLKLKPGMTANITIFTKEANNVLLISAAALRFTANASMGKKLIFAEQQTVESKNSLHTDSLNYKKAMIWVEMGDTLLQKQITTGLNDDVNVEVISGLNLDDNVITGTIALKDKTQKSAVKSPFLPQRPGQKPAAGSTKKP